MTKQEELEKLETEEFMLKMKDHWSNEDFEYDRQLYNKIKQLKEEINNEKSI